MGSGSGVIGLVAGAGEFPEIMARAIKSRGQELVCIQVSGDPAALVALADHYHRCPPGALRELLGALAAHQVREVVVAGRFSRRDLLGSGDSMRDAMMAAQHDRRDVALLERLAAILAGLGIVLVEQSRYVDDLLAPPGLLSARPLAPEEEADLEFGRSVARRAADLDIGQTLVVCRGIILAVEAAEGTDAAIRRGGSMASDAIVVKVSRSTQDPRFDIPAVGPDTIAAMREVSARVLGIDGRRTLLLHRERMMADADAAGISIVAADTPPLGSPVRGAS